jgi:hypothetical protein
MSDDLTRGVLSGVMNIVQTFTPGSCECVDALDECARCRRLGAMADGKAPEQAEQERDRLREALEKIADQACWCRSNEQPCPSCIAHAALSPQDGQPKEPTDAQ